MGSLISRIVFMPPSKHPEQDTENDVFLRTDHGSQIQVKMIKKDENALYLILSHGNAENIEGVYTWAINSLSNFVNVNIVMYEYTGY